MDDAARARLLLAAERLHNWRGWAQSDQSLEEFVRRNRDELDQLFEQACVADAPPKPAGGAMTVDNSSGARPVRTDWRDFPVEYITALNVAGRDGSIQLGPMSWNDARFAQREFYRLIAVLRRMAPTDAEAAKLDGIARRLRVSCPRCETDLAKHWFVLQANPIVEGMK